MRLDINLASRPYENAQRFYMQWVPVLGVLALLAAVLSWTAFSQFAESRRQNRELNELREKIAGLQKVKATATDILGRPENAGTRDHALFLNSLFARKSFSWTQVLTDLEKIMPAQVQVLSIRPTLNQSGELEFSLTVNTTKRDNAIELVRRMESSPRFSLAQIRKEDAKLDPKSNNMEYEVQILAYYEPTLQRGKL
ncbi:MAG TPA: hypothetical protein VM056_01805 [Terriglobales bacterium]|nr:hypothetical protein [Terriglobales bacterium]